MLRLVVFVIGAAVALCIKRRGNNKEKTTAAKRGNYIFKDINKLEVYVKKLFSFGCGLKRGGENPQPYNWVNYDERVVR